MNYKLLYSLLFLSLLSGFLCANTLFSEFKNMTSEGDSGIQAHRVVLKKKPEKIPETNNAIKKISENASISEDIKYILSMKKDTFESTTDFRKKRKIKLDLLQAKWKKCMDSGRECYHSGMAELTNYDADKELAYFKLDWLKSVKNAIAKVKTIKKVNAKIPRHEARKLFSEKKVLPFFINLRYADNDLVVNKMIVGGQYEMGNNKISKPKTQAIRESSYGNNRATYATKEQSVGYQKMRVINIPWDDTLSLRRGPSTRYGKITEIPPDETNLELYQCKYGWCKIHYDKYIGWASEKYLIRYNGNDYRYKRRARVSGISWNDTLAVRAGYSIRHNRIGDLPPDAREIEVRKCYQKWCLIRYGSLTGWSSGKYLRSY